MTLSRRTLMQSGLAAAAPLALPGLVLAQSRGTEITVQYSAPALFRELKEALATEFMRANPDIRISYRAPEAAYEELLQRNLRDAVTRNLPDVAFHGLSRVRTLQERNIPVDLRPFLRDDPETAAQGYSPELRSLGEVAGGQYLIGYSLSTPILYVNTDLVRRAGGNPDALPTEWDGWIALARSIRALNLPDTNGMFFNWPITGNWSWQALVFSHGGTMLTADESRVAFGEAPGRTSARLLRRFVDEAQMPDIRPQVMFADFFAGRLGIMMESTAQLARVTREAGERFAIKTARFPIPGPNPRLPAGGNGAVMFTRDPAKQAAAWRFIKYATGPIGATQMVNHTGYMPATTIPAQRDDLLGRFYRENPNYMTTIRQQDVLTGWYAFPGQNALRITDVINDGLQSIVAKRAEPDAALDGMVTEVQALLPRTRG
ncbi:extracellular solute-binding protein [Falsiroseomonas sp. E2-1-a20]|uniref:extracellular solute-binding protein n=1 Tax=Falsiroseomonas sp. E2-1-a20 TaxID=3239300 RepID=UPI003F3A91C2